MPKPLAIFFLLLFSGRCLCAQDTAAQKRFSVLLSPALAPLSNIEFALQPGLQLRLGRFGLVAEMAFPLHLAQSFYTSRHYTRRGLEAKYYYKENSRAANYVSAQVQYASRRFADDDGGLYFKSTIRRDSRYRYQTARISSPLLVIAVKGGVEVPMGEAFFMDFFGAIGVRTAYTKYAAVTGEEAAPYGWFELSLPKSTIRFDQTISKLHVGGGFRVGYLFRR